MPSSPTIRAHTPGRCGWLARDDKGTWRPLMGSHGQHGESCLRTALQHVPLTPQRLWTSTLQPVPPRSVPVPQGQPSPNTMVPVPARGHQQRSCNCDYRPTLGRKRSCKDGHIATSCLQVQGKRRLREKEIKEEERGNYLFLQQGFTRQLPNQATRTEK